MTANRQRLLLAAVMSGLLLAMLDQTIVGTALPAIVERLGGSESLYVWVVTAYLVPATVSLPIYARLSDRWGRRALLLVGMAIFLLGSGLSAAAQTMEQLVAFRALQGLGAGALEGLSFILVADLYGGKRNAALQGALAGLMGVSFIAGPLLGGFIADGIGWRWVFLVNLPIGLAALAVVASVLPASVGRSEDRRARLDLAGIGLLTLAIGLVLIGLSERVWPLVAAGLLPLAAFVAVERRAAAPIMPPALFAERRTAAILVAGTFGAFGMFATLLLLPRYFQSVEDVSATHSGVLLYPLLVGLIVSINVAGGVIMKRGEFRTVILGGTVLIGLGAFGFATFDGGTPRWEAMVFMALIGLGVGPQLSGLQIALTRTLAPARIGGGLGALMLLRQVGAAVALAAAETLYLRGDDPAVAAGTGIVVIALVGAVIASAALLSVPRPATRFALAA
ncbi:MFS transporter [Solirubrobacter sp. CPCC 204708]|uniref:MFS transporter n=1 Tax=Solirubrobacter deserti TaxID=2282478 RepID=A0ABT4RQU6_9ACTN|nr:MFS transporter [Solirubrobacter deserti]MBE2320606.1 MFS transporter [Solirubrobacter deserti]MDA0140661.1 MFS transporter [Solirubrobacter deserti]